MTTLTEIVASVVVHSSAVAFSHFGVTLDTPQVERPQPVAERIVARSPQRKIEKVAGCQQPRQPHDRIEHT